MAQLRLKKERLTELTTEDLHRVAAAGDDATGVLCLSVLGCGPSMQEACTTAMSCGCQPTWNCA